MESVCALLHPHPPFSFTNHSPFAPLTRTQTSSTNLPSYETHNSHSYLCDCVILPTMIVGIPPSEKQAFFSLLDEYFASRPHRLPPSSNATTTTTAQRGGVAGLTDRATTSISTAAGTAASSAVTSALRDQFARTGLTKSSPSPQANATPSYASNPPSAAGRTLPPPARTAASIPSPPTNLPPGAIASATVLYDYADGSDPDDLVAKQGETVYLTEKISDDWWRAKSQDGDRTGIIPSSYVRVL